MGWLFVGAWWWRWRSPGFESVGPLCCLAFSVGQKWRLRKLTRITQQHNCLQETIQRYSDKLKCQRQEYILLSPIISESSRRSITSRHCWISFSLALCELTHLQKAHFKQWDTKATVVRCCCDLVADMWSICLFAHKDVWKEMSWTG